MEDKPALQRHASLFLYPFFLEGRSTALARRITASPLWEQREISTGSSEALYFPPKVAPILFTNAYTLKEPQAFSLSFAGQALTLHAVRLHLWGVDTGCLVLDLSLTNGNRGEATAARFPDLLDFNESFRYIGDLYAGHRARRASLRVSYKGQDILVARGLEEFLACLLWEGDLTPVFDQRLVVFSFARLAEEPLPERVYKFFNVDSIGYDLPDKKHVNHFFRHHLYRRWQEVGTLYGFTHYSGGCLVASCFICQHYCHSLLVADRLRIVPHCA